MLSGKKDMLYVAELTKSTGGPLRTLDATFIEAGDLEQAKTAALEWAEEKIIFNISGTLVLQLAHGGKGVFTHIYRARADADRC
jgi:hypothetical protein